MNVINVTPEMRVLALGRLGENEVTQFVFDVSDWLEEFPGATIGLANHLPHSSDSYPCAIVSEGDGKYSWTITSAELAVEGEGECELLCVKDSAVKMGKIYTTKIGKSLDPDADPPEEWEGYITQATELKGEAEDAAEDAEAYAVGKRGGTDVESTDPAYHNNAKYYNEQAAGSASSAAGSATTAGNKASDAEAYAVGKRGGVDVESGDAAYHNNSKYYSEQAAGSATAAAASAAQAVNKANRAAIAKEYEDLTYPVAKGTWCWKENVLYEANQTISTSEAWTAAHWTQTTIEEEHCALKTEINSTANDLDEFKDGWGEGEEIHLNLLDYLTPTSTTQYYNVTNNGALALSTASTKTYTSYMIPVKENQQYTMNYPFRYVVPLNASQVPLVTKSNVPGNVETINTGTYEGCKYLAASVDNVYTVYPEAPVALSEGDTASYEVITVAQDLPGWCKDKFDEVEAVIDGADIKKKKNKVFMLTDDSFSEEKSFPEFASSVKGVSMSLVINHSAFTSVKVGLKTASVEHFYAEITDTAINLYDYGTGTPTTTSYTHGLTIADNLSVDIYPNENTSNYFVKIASNGSEYTIPSRFTVSHVGLCYPFASMVGTASFVQFSATCDVNRPIWVFGDSYLGTNNTKRWAYYLVSNDKDNRVVLDGYAGENSESAFASLETLIKMDTPDYIVWCLGMNDGGDSGTTPKPIWLTKIQSLIELCEEENIVPILATIPTVPSVNNEGKNAWVRESGYQYIDFAKAVNANSSGVWFTGMLDTDNVHPTQTGAITLYHAALAGCPQFNQK